MISHPALKKLSAALLTLTAAVSAAAEQKIGVFHLETVFKNYYKTKIAEAYIDAQDREYQQYIDSEFADLQKLESEYAIARDASMNMAIDVIEREKKRQEAESLARNIAARRGQLKEESLQKLSRLEQLAAARRQEIFDDISAVACKKAALEGFTILLDSSARGSGSEPACVVIYAASGIDLTQPILEELNRNNQPPAVIQTAVQPAAGVPNETTTESANE